VIYHQAAEYAWVVPNQVPHLQRFRRNFTIFEAREILVGPYAVEIAAIVLQTGGMVSEWCAKAALTASAQGSGRPTRWRSRREVNLWNVPGGVSQHDDERVTSHEIDRNSAITEPCLFPP